MTIRKNHSGPAMSAPWRNATRSSRQKTRHITAPSPAGQRQAADGIRGPGSGWWVVRMTIPPCAVRRHPPGEARHAVNVNGGERLVEHPQRGAGQPHGPAPPGAAARPRAGRPARPQIPPARPAPAPPGDARRRRGGRSAGSPAPSGGFNPRLVPYPQQAGMEAVAHAAGARPASTPRRRPGAPARSAGAAGWFFRAVATGDLHSASTVNDSPRNILSSRSQYRSLASSIPTHQRPVRNLV